MKEDFVYLLHIAEAITDIQSYVSGGKDKRISEVLIMSWIEKEAINESNSNFNGVRKIQSKSPARVRYRGAGNFWFLC